MNTIRFHVGDVRDVMAGMADSHVDLVVTSPPFLALRSYLPADHPDKHREIGSEPTPATFLDTMLGLTQEWRRIVTPTGSIAVEIGDTYSGSSAEGSDTRGLGRVSRGFADGVLNDKKAPGWPLAKSLCGIPTLYTWSLAYGCNLLNPAFTFDPWRIRNLLVWTRPNPPVGALGDKFRPATSYVTVACTSDRRWFDLDAVRLPASEKTNRRNAIGVDERPNTTKVPTSGSNRQTLPIRDPDPDAGAPPLDWWDDTEPGVTYVTVACTSDRRWFDLDAVRTEAQPGTYGTTGTGKDRSGNGFRGVTQGPTHYPRTDSNPAGAPPLDWWDHTPDWQPLHNMPTAPYKGAHYATYPVTLPRRLIEAMCPREVCTVCGEARRRIVEPSAKLGYSVRGDEADGVNSSQTPQSRTGNAYIKATGLTYTHNITLGWSDCGHYDPVRGTLYPPYRPGVVLDPFAGSGTTALAAALCGRDAILIDIDPRNVALARRRIGDHIQILGEKVTRAYQNRTAAQGRAGRTPSHIPPHQRPTQRDLIPALRVATVTWTVDAQLPGLKNEHPDQQSLFETPEAI